MKQQPKRTAIIQEWLESERGWGQRPDGCSVHLSREDLGTYVEEYWASMPKEVPSEYSRPCGDAYLAQVDVHTYKQLRKNNKQEKYGLRLWELEFRKLQKKWEQ